MCVNFGLSFAVGGSAHDFDQNALDRDAAGVKCPWRMALRLDRGESDFVAFAGVNLQRLSAPSTNAATTSPSCGCSA